MDGLTVPEQHVEGDEARRDLTRQLADPRLGGMQPHLHEIELQPPLLLDHDFSIERRVRGHLLAERSQLGEIAEQRSAVSAPKTECAAVVLEYTTEAVPLRLVPNVRADRDLLDEQGLLRRERNVRSRGRHDLARRQPTRRWITVRRSSDAHRFTLSDEARPVAPRGFGASPKMSAKDAALFGALRENRVLRLLGDPELEHALRGNRDRLTGRRVAAHPRLSVDDDELPDPGNREPVPRFLVRERRELVQELPHLLLGEAGLLGQSIHGLRL